MRNFTVNAVPRTARIVEIFLRRSAHLLLVLTRKTLGLKVTSLTLNAVLVGIICVGTMGRTQLPSCRHKGHVNSPFLGLNGCI